MKSSMKALRVTLQKDWTIQARSRQLVLGKVGKLNELRVETEKEENWIIEPSKLILERDSVLVAKTLCQRNQMEKGIPVEIYNPTDEIVQLYRDTTLGVASLTTEVSEAQIETIEGRTHIVRETRKEKTEVDEKALPEELQKLVEETTENILPTEVKAFENLLKKYRDVFSTKNEPLGQTDVVKHDIQVTSAPIKLQYRRIPMGLREEAVTEEERMKKLGVIEPSESPWAAPVVLVRKKDGTIRYCIDYRRLNQVTKKDSYPLPNIQDCLDSLDGAKYFSSIDLCSGYWQVQMTEEAKDKTSFYGAGGGLWRFKVMPFGLCNAPATFERLMERVLGQLQWQICLCYLDDVLIFGKSVQQHLDRLEQVFQRLREAKLKLKPKKCHFFQVRVQFLGHIVSQDGVGTDPEKVLRISECPVPKNVHEVRSALGLFSYYRRFIPHFSETAKPLIRLTEKDRKYSWDD